MIRHLQPEDASAFVVLRRQYLVEFPLVFASSPDDDPASLSAVREILENASNSTIIGAFDRELIGVVALYRDPRLKASHKAHIWGMYVGPTHRGRGVGSALLEAALDHARKELDVDIVHLSVTSAAPGAQRLYERAGFRVWGTEPDALRHGGRSVAEHYLMYALVREAMPESS